MKHVLISIFLTILVVGLSSRAEADLARSVLRVNQIAGFPSVAPGTIVIRKGEFALYFVGRDGTAIRYPVALAKQGKQWYGSAHVKYMERRPAWQPPAEVRRDHPSMANVFAPYPQNPSNPMGEGAMLLDRDEYAIHGTNAKTRGSVGTMASYGCVRMRNEDLLDLWQYVQVGTPVLVTK